MNDDIMRGVRWFMRALTVVLAVAVLLFFIGHSNKHEEEMVVVDPLHFVDPDFLVERIRADVETFDDKRLLAGLDLFKTERHKEYAWAHHYIKMAEGESGEKEQAYLHLAKGHLDTGKKYDEVVVIFLEEMNRRLDGKSI